MTYQFIRGKYNSDGSITLHTRSDKGKDKIRVLGFQPYFYVKKEVSIPSGENGSLLEVNEGFEDVYGNKLKKLIMKTPTDVGGFREKFDKHWEADIDFIRRFLIDTKICSGFDVLTKKKVVHYTDLVPTNFSLPPVESFFDIETYTSTRFPESRYAKQKITCATVWDTTIRKYLTILLSDRTSKGKLSNDHILFRVPNELREVLWIRNYFAKVNPDVVAQWSNFDFDYLYPRAKRLNVKLDCMDSICIFNLLEAYAKLYKKGSNRLKDVVFDEGIVDYIEPEVNYAKLYDENPVSLVMRNKRHVEWMVKLNSKKGGGDLIRFYWNLKNISGLEDLRPTLYHGVMVDTLMLRKYHGKYVLPSKAYVVGCEDLTGGLVKQPPKGVFENIAVYDMSRYYQSIMIALNVTPEECEGLGLAPQVAQDMLDERDFYDNELIKLTVDTEEYKSMKSVRDSVKYVGEAIIGYFGSPRSRLYNPKLFNKVTQTAQKGLLYLTKKAEELGYLVLYFDTDGIFVQVPREKIAKVANALNQSLEGFAEELGIKRKFKLKCDRFFGKIIFKGVKKRYAGRVLWEDGKDVDYLHIKGFEYVRRDASAITKKVQRKCFEEILRGSKKSLVEYLSSTVKNMKNNRFSFSEVAIIKTIKMKFRDYKVDTDFVRGAKLANRYLGADIRAGDRVKMLYVKRVPKVPERTNVICFLDEDSLPEGIVVDWDKMINRTVKGKVKDLLEICGLSWNQIIGQRRLLEVFS